MTEAWRTIDLVRIEGEAYAYQQCVKIEKASKKVEDHNAHGRFKERKGYGVGVGLASATIPKDTHRLVPMRETVDDESIETVLDDE